MQLQAIKRIGDKKVCKIFKNSLTKASVISIIKTHSRIYTRYVKRMVEMRKEELEEKSETEGLTAEEVMEYRKLVKPVRHVYGK